MFCQKEQSGLQKASNLSHLVTPNTMNLYWRNEKVDVMVTQKRINKTLTAVENLEQGMSKNF